ncbi:MAG: hypothetical protein ACK4I8_12150, partial [Armatimonadota bacterium]
AERPLVKTVAPNGKLFGSSEVRLLKVHLQKSSNLLHLKPLLPLFVATKVAPTVSQRAFFSKAPIFRFRFFRLLRRAALRNGA